MTGKCRRRMNLSPEDYGSLALVLRVSRVLGLVPYESLARLRVFRPALLYSCALHLVCSVIITMVSLSVFWLQFNVGALFGVVWAVGMVLQLSVPVLALVRVQSKLDNVAFVLSRAKQICRTIKYNPTNVAPRKMYSVFITIVYVTSAILVVIMDYLVLKGKQYTTLQQVLLIFRVLWIALADFMFLLLSLQFMLLVAKINGTLGAVNRGLEDLYMEIKDSDRESGRNVDMATYCNAPGVRLIHVRSKKTVAYKRESVHLRLRELVTSYLRSCQLARRMDGGAGALLLQLLSFSVFHILRKMYPVIHFTLQDSWSVLPVQEILHIALTMLSRCATYLGTIILLVTPCHDWTEQLENTRFLMSDIMCEAPADNAAFEAELHIFYIQLMVNQPSYSVLGLFSVGRPLLLTIAAIIITYLAVLLEY